MKQVDNREYVECGSIFPLTKEFWYFRANGKLRTPCKKCISKRQKNWYLKKEGFNV